MKHSIYDFYLLFGVEGVVWQKRIKIFCRPIITLSISLFLLRVLSFCSYNCFALQVLNANDYEMMENDMGKPTEQDALKNERKNQVDIF